MQFLCAIAASAVAGLFVWGAGAVLIMVLKHIKKW